jgi:hypothetical protein
VDRPVATAPIAAAGLIAGYAVAVVSGSRPLGGVVLATFGLFCVGIWLVRDGARTAIQLTAVGLAAFALSHLFGLVIGAWPAVLLCAAGTAAACWRLSDARARARARLGRGARQSIGTRTRA